MEINGLAVADGQQYLPVNQLFNAQIHTVDHLIAVLFGAGEFIHMRLVAHHAVPCVRLVRTQDDHRVDRVHMVRGQYQSGD